MRYLLVLGEWLVNQNHANLTLNISLVKITTSGRDDIDNCLRNSATVMLRSR